MNPTCRGLLGGRVPVVVACIALVVLGLPGAADAQTETEGEYGLRVTVSDGEIGVGWLTPGAESGVLRVLADDSVVFEAVTPPSGAHYVTFPSPYMDVELRYGAAGSTTYSTTVFLGLAPATRRSGELTGVDSLFVVGDVHGEYDRLHRLLGNGGLVDGEGRWTGGRRHVVFLGDIFDRGADVTRTLWFMYRLEREARRAGGGAHVVLGNHETMIFTEDLRYVSAKEQLVARLHGVTYTEMFDIRTSILGRWLVSRPGVMRIDDALMAHGGIVPEIQPRTVAAVNDSVRAYLAEDLFYAWADPTVALANDSATAEAVRDQYARVIVMDSAAVARRMALIFDERSILWYRGYVETDSLEAELDDVLRTFGATVHVVGHTPVDSVASMYDGRLLAVDLFEAAAEMLLLTRDGEGRYRAERVGLEGAPRPL